MPLLQYDKQLVLMRSKADAFKIAANDLFKRVKDAERERVGFVRTTLLEMLKVIDVADSPNYKKIYNDASSTISATNADVDMAKLTEKVGIEEPLEHKSFEPWKAPEQPKEQPDGSLVCKRGEGAG